MIKIIKNQGSGKKGRAVVPLRGQEVLHGVVTNDNALLAFGSEQACVDFCIDEPLFCGLFLTLSSCLVRKYGVVSKELICFLEELLFQEYSLTPDEKSQLKEV